MFAGEYNDWTHKKVKAIIDHYGAQSFIGKRILDLGSGSGEIAGSMGRLGAEVVAVEVRKEHANIISKKYPHVKVMQLDLDNQWPFVNQKFDFVIDIATASHLKDLRTHLIKVCNATDNLILEMEVCDSDHPDFCMFVEEHRSVYDWSYNGIGVKPSAAHVEKILTECGMKFERFDSPQLNTSTYKYDWLESNSGKRSVGQRRFWFAQKNEQKIHMPIAPITANFPKPVIQFPANIPAQQAQLPPPITGYTPNRDFKVAICISGHMRAFEATFESLKHAIIGPLNADVFISTWESLGTPFRGFDQRIVRMNTNDYISRINYLYRPKKLFVEPFIHFPYRPKLIEKNWEGRDLNGILSMYYKIKMCNDLKSQYEKENNFTYDCVIRYRADLFILQAPMIRKGMDLNKIYLPNFFDWGGYNDQFAYSSSQVMDIYSSLFDNIEKYMDEGMYINPEKLLKHHIDKNGIPVDRSEIGYYIRRDN